MNRKAKRKIARKMKEKRDSGISREYVISEGINASGGNGFVREAVDKKTQEKCAIKWLKNLSDKTAVRRFKNEIQMLEKCVDISGAIHIIKHDESYLWYTMPIAKPFHEVSNQMILLDALQGETEQEFQDRMGGNLHQFIELFLHLAKGLKKMHERGIAHRDIKPANILFYDGKPVFIDFGLALDKETPLDVTTDARALGAKFTMAPEMRRNPSKADYFKADVYSLAKTLWIYLSGCPTGFEGAYSPWDELYGLRGIPRFRRIHLAEIEELLMIATDADPNHRPSMDEFVNTLEQWLKSDMAFYTKEREEWCFMGKLLLGNSSAETVVWRKQEDIKRVLKRIADTQTTSHAHFSDGGGLDYTDVIDVSEENCIGLVLQGRLEIMRPRALRLEAFKNHYEWNYLLLELETLEPQGSDGSDDSESLTEDVPGNYVAPECMQYGVYDYEKGGKLPSTARPVVRRLRGNLLFPPKFGSYNGMSETYDGRHGRMSAEVFREYMAGLIVGASRRILGAIPADNANAQHDVEGETDERERCDSLDSNACDEYRKQYSPVWRYEDELLPGEVRGKLKFCFAFAPSPIRMLGEDSSYLMPNGSLGNINHEGLQPFYVYNAACAEVLLDALNHWVENLCLSAGYRDKYHVPFSIQQEKNGFPEHMFSREELAEILRSADDRVYNTLVVDDNGHFRIIQDRTSTWKYALTIEYFIPYTNQVGPYSPLCVLDELYSTALHQWLYYLLNGRDKRSKIYEREEDSLLEEKILEIYSAHNQ